MIVETTVDLSGRRVVVAGGTGSVGEGLVRGFARAGAEVIVPSRSQQRADQFRTVLGEDADADRVRLIVADYTTPDAAVQLADRVEAEFGPVTDAAAAIGGWWSGGPLWGTSQAAWQEYFVNFATAHLAMAQAFVPRVPADGAYHIMLGGSAVFPVPGSGIVSMQQAALLMMGRVLQSETQGQRRVFTHLLGVVNNRNRPQRRAEWISATDVGALAAALSADPAITSEHYELLDHDAFLRAWEAVRGAEVDA